MTSEQDEEIDANIWHFEVGDRHTDNRNKQIDGDHDLIKIDPETNDPKWYHDIGNAFKFGAPVLPDNIMTRYQWYGAPPDDVNHSKGAPLVSESFKQVIEKFEPNLHQFFPVELVGVRKTHVANRFLFVPNVALRCFSRLSIGYEPLGWEKHWGDHIWHVQRSSRHPRAIFEDDAIRGHHVWVAIDFWNPMIMVSSDLKKALLEASLSNMKFLPMETRERLQWQLPEIVKSRFAIDPPWTDWSDNSQPG